VRTVDATELEARRRSLLAELGRIRSSDAKGFLVDLNHFLEEAGLTNVKARWRGDDPCAFTATGEFQGDSADVEAGLLIALGDDVAYDEAIAAVTTSSDGVHVSFLTWATELGVASVCIDLSRSLET
jgi:hypothetical protein